MQILGLERGSVIAEFEVELGAGSSAEDASALEVRLERQCCDKPLLECFKLLAYFKRRARTGVLPRQLVFCKERIHVGA